MKRIFLLSLGALLGFAASCVPPEELGPPQAEVIAFEIFEILPPCDENSEFCADIFAFCLNTPLDLESFDPTTDLLVTTEISNTEFLDCGELVTPEGQDVSSADPRDANLCIVKNEFVILEASAACGGTRFDVEFTLPVGSITTVQYVALAQ